jgi:D-methionine transport system permease protein
MFSEMFLKRWDNGLIQKGIWETIYMTVLSSAISYVIGLPLGVILNITDKDGINPIHWLNRILGLVVNFFRSIPFIILMVAIIPFTRMIVGSSIGTTAAIVPLTITAAPFIARVIESSLLEVDRGVIEAAQSMGASPVQIIWKVMLPESLHSIVLGITLALIALIGASAMAGALGGGGLGDLAIRYGYQRFQMDVMIATVVVLIVMVQGVQSIGNTLSRKLNKNKLS